MKTYLLMPGFSTPCIPFRWRNHFPRSSFTPPLPPPPLLPLPLHQRRRAGRHLQPRPRHQETRAPRTSCLASLRTTWEAWLQLQCENFFTTGNKAWLYILPFRSIHPSSPSMSSPGAQYIEHPSRPHRVSSCHRMSWCRFSSRTLSTCGSWEGTCRSGLWWQLHENIMKKQNIMPYSGSRPSFIAFCLFCCLCLSFSSLS